MLITDNVKWTLLDFLIAMILLLGTGLICGFILRKVNKPILKVALCVILFTTLILVFAEIGVGIPGTPLSGN